MFIYQPDINVDATPKVAILGAGAVGQLIGHQLLSSSHTIGYITATMKTCEPMAMDVLEGKSVNYPLKAIQQTSKWLANIELLIVTVKAYQVKSALSSVIPLLPQSCQVLLLHNGLGTHQEVAASLHQQQGLLLGTTSQGAKRCSQWHTQHTGQGLTQIGHFSGVQPSSKLLGTLTAAIPTCEIVDDILTSLWYKLAVNAVVNPLTAINQCKNGELLSPKFQLITQHILEELQTVAQVENIQLDSNKLQQRVEQVISLTANNFSSMHQDVSLNKTTEINYINGYLLTLAKKHGISLPENQKLVDSIRLMTQ